ncbi:hypothetical protein GCM10018780_85610 [Streptomyces lanatus]|nr:hypothetical protein GCM10018780_85610 [Streptomyces lanatus]
MDMVGTVTTAEVASKGFAVLSGRSVPVVAVPVSVGPDSGPAPGGQGGGADREGGRGAVMCGRRSSPC